MQVEQHSMSINRTKVEAEERCTPSGVNHIVRVCALEGSRNMPEAEAIVGVAAHLPGRWPVRSVLQRLGKVGLGRGAAMFYRRGRSACAGSLRDMRTVAYAVKCGAGAGELI